MSLFVEVFSYGNVHVSVNPHGRLHVSNKYVTVSFHPYCGPEFFHGDKVFEPVDEKENDALWEAFGKWHEKFKANEEKLRAQGKTIYRSGNVK